MGRRQLPPQIKKHTEDGRVYWELRGSFGGRNNRKEVKRRFDTETAALDVYNQLIGQKAPVRPR